MTKQTLCNQLFQLPTIISLQETMKQKLLRVKAINDLKHLLDYLKILANQKAMKGPLEISESNKLMERKHCRRKVGSLRCPIHISPDQFFECFRSF